MSGILQILKRGNGNINIPVSLKKRGGIIINWISSYEKTEVGIPLRWFL
jgi:hypothetical protein